MTNNLTARLLLAAALTVTLTVSAQATESVYRLVRGAHILDFYDRTCKPGSLSLNARGLIRLVVDNSPSDLNSRIVDEIAAKAKERGPAYCTQLERELDVNSFNASADKRGVMEFS